MEMFRYLSTVSFEFLLGNFIYHLASVARSRIAKYPS